MSLSIISSSSKKEEDEILNNIFKLIDEKRNTIFNSGAGSGKTYALIESIKYIVKKYGEGLSHHNQKIMCITYTNVATKEINERLGNSEIVKVSTIHERIWDMIKNYQKELLKIHIEKLEEEIEKIDYELNNDKDKESKYASYRELSYEKKEELKSIMIEHKDKFYKNFDKSANDMKNVFKEILCNYSNILRNVGNFKSIISKIYKTNNYLLCLENIKNGEDNNYKIVKYDATFNSDYLHRMLISHDTLLEYGLKIISNYNLLKQIIINIYPYILIDEYQDTDEKVVKIMNILSDYSEKINQNIFICYFGDTAQNIYDNGVGSEIEKIHLKLEQVNKKFNRRSTKEVIDVINRIRNDKIEQESIYDDCEGGSVKFYKGDKEDKTRFIEKYSKEWNINSENKLHCLVLTNKLVAEFSGFKNIHSCFSLTQYYQKAYDRLNVELLSNDLSKLGEIPLLFFKIIKLINNIQDGKTPLTELLSKELYSNMNLGDLKELMNLLLSINGETFLEYTESIFKCYSNSKNKNYEKIINNVLGNEIYSYQEFYKYILNSLYENIDENEIEEAKLNLENLLSIRMDEYNIWYRFILEEPKENVVYHTYHGTKGLEFKNVIIIMEKDFGINRNLFNHFFKNRNIELKDKEKNKFEKTKNLLYVSCSRAIENLRVFYIDDTSEFEEGIKEIFGEIYDF